jgi:hypothetical protein
VLKTDYLKKPAEIPDSDKQMLFIPGMPTGIKALDVSDNGVLPSFTRQLRFEVSSTSIYDVKPPKVLFDPFLCQVSTDVGVDGINPDQCLTRVALVREPAQDQEDSKPGKAVWAYNLRDWPPTDLPALYGLCSKVDQREFKDADGDNAYKKQRNKQYYCLRFAVPEPLFGETSTEPWLLKRVNLAATQETYVVVFGVVDKDLISFIGRDNLSWRNQHAKVRAGHSSNKSVPAGKEVYGTTVDAQDEATTLGLAMRSFDLDWKVKHPKARLYKVLLAQMTRGKAEALVANLANSNFSDTSERFDLVISAAADFSAATANEHLIFDRPLKPPTKVVAKSSAADKDSELPEFRHFVVVPWLSYDSSGHRLPNPLRLVTLADRKVAESKTDQREFTVSGNYEQWFPLSEPVNQDKLQACYDIIARNFLKDEKHYWREQLPAPTGNDNEPDCSELSSRADPKLPFAPKLNGAFELAVLSILRDGTHADVAMLQKRSFYWGPFPSPLHKANLAQSDGELLDRILWQGDFLRVLPVKGSTLKKVLEESDKLDALDEQATNEIVETKRGLLALGVEKTSDQQYLVDGIQLDPNRLYTVATSNHIAAGDNGYPELADPQFANVRLATVDKDKDADDETPRIGTLVCQKLSEGGSCVSNPGLLFASVQNPTPLPPQLEPALTAFAKAYEHSILGNPDLPRDTFSRTNYQAQLVPTWRISLKDFSFSFSSVRNNLTESQRLTELGGVTEPLAGNAKSHAFNFSTHEEWVRSGKWMDEFVRGMFQFQDTVTGNTLQVPILTSSGTLVNSLAPAPALTTYMQNQGATDLGIFWHPGTPWHLSPHKYFTKFGFVFEPLTHFDTQLASQNLIFPPVPDPAGNGKILVPEIPINLPFNQNWLGRFAFRGESDKNHLEIGYQGGWELKTLETLGSNLGPCPPPLNVTLCVESWELQSTFVPGSISQTRDRRERNGPYMDMDWNWPLIWRLSFRTQESFAYYFPSHFDNAIDTLYRNDLIETLNFKLFPNLNFGPSLERFDYENKFEHVHLRTWSPSFKMTYSFDWLEGSRRGKSLRYPSSAGGSASE